MPPFIIKPEDLWPAIFKLANESDRSYRFTKKGDSRPLADVKAQMDARRANVAKKRLAAAERIEAATRAKRKIVKPGQSIADRMLRAMAPGSWYGMGDLARLAGVERNGRGKVHQVMVRRGWIERQRNPQWSGKVPNPWEIMDGAEPEPEWLYRMTAVGEARQKG